MIWREIIEGAIVVVSVAAVSLLVAELHRRARLRADLWRMKEEAEARKTAFYRNLKVFGDEGSR